MDYFSHENLVEAIEEGKIVKVSEKYAKREGLPILRKSRKEENEQYGSQRCIRKLFSWKRYHEKV